MIKNAGSLIKKEEKGRRELRAQLDIAHTVLCSYNGKQH